jgi:hypothetical protein
MQNLYTPCHARAFLRFRSRFHTARVALLRPGAARCQPQTVPAGGGRWFSACLADEGTPARPGARGRARCHRAAPGRRSATQRLRLLGIILTSGIRYRLCSSKFVPSATSGKNMKSDHTIRCDHTISKKWTSVHTKNVLNHTTNHY